MYGVQYAVEYVLHYDVRFALMLNQYSSRAMVHDAYGRNHGLYASRRGIRICGTRMLLGVPSILAAASFRTHPVLRCIRFGSYDVATDRVLIFRLEASR